MPRVNRDPSLFEVSAKVPDGFIYHENFISEAEEHELIREIQILHLTPFKYYQFTGKRRTASFGWQYDFGTSEITTAPDIPEFLLPVRMRAGTFLNIDPTSLVQMSIIEYSTGSPIGWHRDILHFGLVVGISLAQRAGSGFENSAAPDRKSQIVMRYYRSNYSRAQFI